MLAFLVISVESVVTFREFAICEIILFIWEKKLDVRVVLQISKEKPTKCFLKKSTMAKNTFK